MERGLPHAPLAAAGHLLAFGTGSDGGYVVRLAHVPPGGDALSVEERPMMRGARPDGGDVADEA